MAKLNNYGDKSVNYDKKSKIAIDEIKEIEYNILCSFADFCENNNLRYFLDSGTLLGAVRHKGFIPWDDEIDVAMPRPDYERFKQLTKENDIGAYYETFSYDNKKTNYNFMKIIDNRTIVFEEYLKPCYTIGVYIDVFPIDGLPNNTLLRNLMCIRLNLWRNLLVIKMTESGAGKTKLKTFLKKIILAITAPISISDIHKKMDHAFDKYAYDDSKYVGMVNHDAVYKAVVEKADYDPIQMMFEKRNFCVPSGYDRLLRQVYGDYNKLPPVEDRFSHGVEAYWKE